MKTFKLVTLAILQPEISRKVKEIPLIDGLIINKEDGENRWMVEAFIDKSFYDFFNDPKNAELILQVTISQKTNDPAALHAKVHSITLMDEQISVLFDGVLASSKIDLAEVILAELLEEGLEGDMLLEKFREQLLEKRTPSKVK
ncbi:YwpF-like family protein [Bacillus timonensis]|nr:YwpF-like family protein [Bacillus timonensis]